METERRVGRFVRRRRGQDGSPQQARAGMSDDREHRVRTRAYHIWERDGRAGRAEDHWLEAEAEIGRESEAPAAAPPEPPSPEQPKKPARRGRRFGFAP